MAINLTRRGARLSLRTYSANGKRACPGCALRMAKRNIQTTSQSRPASSWPVTSGRHGHISVKHGAGDKNRKTDSGFLRGLGDFNLTAVGDGLRAGVGVNDIA